MSSPHPNRRVFTLVDLLVVIAVLAVLAAVLFPVFAQARAGAGKGSFMGRVRATGVAYAMYAQDYDDDDLAPNGIHFNRGRHDAGGHGHGGGGNGISYHGGPLILGGVNVYYIWYGNWSGNSATTILTDLAQSIGGSPYFNINTTYYDGSNIHVSNSVHYAGSTTDSYSHG